MITNAFFHFNFMAFNQLWNSIKIGRRLFTRFFSIWCCNKIYCKSSSDLLLFSFNNCIALHAPETILNRTISGIWYYKTVDTQFRKKISSFCLIKLTRWKFYKMYKCHLRINLYIGKQEIIKSLTPQYTPSKSIPFIVPQMCDVLLFKT